MINILNRYHGYEPSEKNIPIYRGSPLGNPFKIGDQSVVTLKTLTRDDVIKAYEEWLLAQIRLNNPVVIQALDRIAYRIIDGLETNLLCFCKPRACHGDVIKRIVEDRLGTLGLLPEH